MRSKSTGLIYKNFAEFRLRLHMTEIRSKYLLMMMDDEEKKVFNEFYKIYRKELSEKLNQLLRQNIVAVSELEQIRKDYLHKFQAKTLMN